jgi:hypothetical protein
MLIVYLILVVWLAVLTHLIVIGRVGWPFVILSFVCWNLILAISLDTSPKEKT